VTTLDEDAQGLGRIGPLSLAPDPATETSEDGPTRPPSPEEVVELEKLDEDHPLKRLTLRYLIDPPRPLHYYNNHLWGLAQHSQNAQNPLFHVTEHEANSYGLPYNPAGPPTATNSPETIDASPTGDTRPSSLENHEDNTIRPQLDSLNLDFPAVIISEDPWWPQLLAPDYMSTEWNPSKSLRKYVWGNRVHSRESQFAAQRVVRIIMQIRNSKGVSWASTKFWFD
jgi:hypothetical protein